MVESNLCTMCRCRYQHDPVDGSYCSARCSEEAQKAREHNGKGYDYCDFCRAVVGTAPYRCSCKDPFISTSKAARERGLYPSTFRRRAEKLGVRFEMGSRVWAGYTWNKADLARLMPVTR